MIFPIGDDNVKGGAYPFFSYLFLAINTIVFLYTLPNLQEIVNMWGANPCSISKFENLKTVISSMFLHGGIFHLLGNMLFLWIFADNIESTIGNFRFLIFYLAGGIVATATHVLISGSSGCVPLVGASGAIAAVMGAYLAMFPKSQIKMLFILFVFRIPAYIFLGLWFLQQVLSGFTDLNMMMEPEEGGGIAFWAHIGGFVFGFLMGLYFKYTYPKVQEMEMMEPTRHMEYQTVKMPPKRYNNRF